jgi:hypothetical protein
MQLPLIDGVHAGDYYMHLFQFQSEQYWQYIGILYNLAFTVSMCALRTIVGPPSKAEGSVLKDAQSFIIPCPPCPCIVSCRVQVVALLISAVRASAATPSAPCTLYH